MIVPTVDPATAPPTPPPSPKFRPVDTPALAALLRICSADPPWAAVCAAEMAEAPTAALNSPAVNPTAAPRAAADSPSIAAPMAVPIPGIKKGATVSTTVNMFLKLKKEPPASIGTYAYNSG